MPEFAVTAIGRDRPGIAAAISGALLELGGNIEDSQMSILRGQFAVVLIVSLADPLDRAAVEDRLERVRTELSLEAVTLDAIDDPGAATARPSHVIRVHGADHPGIVHAVASALAERGVNITGLETRVAGAADSRIYVMIMEVALAGASEDEVASVLDAVGEGSGVEVSIGPLDAEAL
ncbi:MAG: glycine cleavage system protein R [Solirubrobacterales bacterium]